MQKKILFVNRHAPYGTSAAKDALDGALSAAVYDQDISLLFMDDGVFQLLKSQNGRDVAQKNLDGILSALPYYDIDKIYVHKGSIEQRQITRDDLVTEEIEILEDLEVTELFSRQDHILSF